MTPVLVLIGKESRWAEWLAVLGRGGRGRQLSDGFVEESKMNRKLLVMIVCMALIVASGSAFAGRPDKAFKSWFGHFGVGYSVADSDFGDIFDDDWQFNGGATYWPEDWAIGLELDLGYSNYDASNSAVRALNDAIDDAIMMDPSICPGGGCNIDGIDFESWTLGVSGVWGPDTSGSVGFYLKAGVGAYFMEGRAKQNGLVYYPPVCDPWFWWCYPGGVGPGTFIVGKESATEFGWNASVGVTFDMNSGSQIYLEANYRRSELDRGSVTYIPITVGFKW